MKLFKLLLLFPIFPIFLVPTNSLKAMELDPPKGETFNFVQQEEETPSRRIENYLEILPVELYDELLKFKGKPEIGFWLSQHLEQSIGFLNTTDNAADYSNITPTNMNTQVLYKKNNQCIYGSWETIFIKNLSCPTDIYKIEAPGMVKSLAIDEEHNRLIIGSEKGSITILDLDSNIFTHSFNIKNEEYSVTFLMLDNLNNKLLASSFINPEIKVFSLFDTALRKELGDINFMKHYALMKTYEQWKAANLKKGNFLTNAYNRYKNGLNLTQDPLLFSGFSSLPPSLQETIKNTITIIIPGAPVSWADWFLRKE